MSVLSLLAPGGGLEIMAIILMAASPVGECRLAVPMALFVYDMTWSEAVVFAMIGNIAVMPLLFWLYPKIENALRRWERGARGIDWVFSKTRKKHSARFEKYEHFAIVGLVATPIPGTGGWMGAFAAWLFDVPGKKAFPLLYSGIVISCFLVLVICISAEGFARAWLLP